MMTAEKHDNASRAPVGRRVSHGRNKFATYNRKDFKVIEGKMTQITCPELVRIMTIAEGYAMVRKKGGMPFVISEKDLFYED